jgi:hypothetical protein
MPESIMTTNVIIGALAFTVLAGMLAIAQISQPQTTRSATVHVKHFDRCPYYPSPVFCRSRAGEQDQLDHDVDARG